MQSLKPFLNHSNNFNKCFHKCRQALQTLGLMHSIFLLLHVPSIQHCSAQTDYNNVIFALAFCGLPSDSINRHVKLLRSSYIGSPDTIVLHQWWGNTYPVPICTDEQTMHCFIVSVSLKHKEAVQIPKALSSWRRKEASLLWKLKATEALQWIVSAGCHSQPLILTTTVGLVRESLKPISNLIVCYSDLWEFIGNSYKN